ncbi:uncharacterized protein LOC118433442 [Folsomia candida]|uniref:uncharacterized protein LOC118433442 n=1 Tax=Folsomia candida TaxID=158441 RepID=UPI0016054F3A|nr:uncharacterized protein LOC118433442 [Folsomia candida]
MNGFDHITGGTEIFEVAGLIRWYITNYIGSVAYQMLPDIVKSLFEAGQANSTQLYYIDDITGEKYPMHEHLGLLQPSVIYPFSISVVNVWKFRIQSDTGRSWDVEGGEIISISGTSFAELFSAHLPTTSMQYFHHCNRNWNLCSPRCYK